MQIKNNPEVSVIIPAYNGANYICESLESVLSQTYRHFEIIIIDDGSTDNTREVLEPYIRNSSIRYFYQDNAGHGAARNAGINYAQGKHVCFLDQDDLYEKDSIERRVYLFEKYPELGFVYSDFRMALASNNSHEVVYKESLWAQCNIVEMMPKSCIEAKGNDFYIFNKSVFPELIINCFTWIGTVMIRKEVFDDAGLFDINLRWSPDHDLCIRIARNYSIGFLNTSTAVYKQHASNMSLDRTHLYDDGVKIRIKYLDPQWELQDRDKRRLRVNIGEWCFRKGYVLLGTKQHFSTMKDFLIGIKYDPFCFKYYLYLLSATLPPKMYSMLRKLWKSIMVHFRSQKIISFFCIEMCYIFTLT